MDFEKVVEISQVSQIISCAGSVIVGTNVHITAGTFMKTESTAVSKYMDGELEELFADEVTYLFNYQNSLIFTRVGTRDGFTFNFESLSPLNLPIGWSFISSSNDGVSEFLFVANDKINLKYPLGERPGFMYRQDEEIIRLESVGLFVLHKNRMYAYSSKHAIVSCYEFNNDLVWSYDASVLGKKKYYDRKGELRKEIENRVRYEIMVDDKRIYVPLIDGKMVALNAIDGQPLWIFDKLKNGSRFSQDGKYIYYMDANKLMKIKKSDGATVGVFPFRDYISDLLFNGPIWVYEDVILLLSPSNKSMMVISKDFQDHGCCSIEKAGIPNSLNSLVWHDNKLFVLDHSNTLHVFKLDLSTQ